MSSIRKCALFLSRTNHSCATSRYNVAPAAGLPVVRVTDGARELTELGLAAAIDADCGGLDALKAAMTDAGIKRFGSGWSWLVVNGGTLEVMSTPNQDSPISEGKTPILGIDVWEHAYYLEYQNKRPVYLEAWWNVVNWDAVAARYDAAS